jgi:fructose-1,6-bisphosphatase I
MHRLISVLKQDNVDIELILLIRSLLASCKEITFRVSQGELSGVLGSTLTENVQGETQKKLDVITNQMLKDILLSDDSVRAIASEEEDEIVIGHEKGLYNVAFDPLDGSSNIDVNGQIGTIFTIYPTLPDLPANSPEQFLQGGRAQLVAGYVLYGPSTILVMTTGGPTRGFTLDLTHGGFLLTTPEFKIPTTTNEYALNMANYPFWTSHYQSHFGPLFVNNQTSSAPTLRWNAAMVGDVHRVISRGGVYFYPGDKRDNMEQGKLRLLYEANPMAWLTENAGGTAVADTQAILDINPSSLHQRTSVLLGSSQTVSDIVKA